MKKRNCPICQSLNSKLIMPVVLKNFDNIKTPLSTRVSECLDCGFIFNDNEIDVELLNGFYTNDNYYFVENSFGTGGKDVSRYEMYEKILDPYINKQDVIVDVGCGKAQFVKYLIDQGYSNTCGVELDKRMCQIAIGQGIPVEEGSSSKLPFGSMSVDLLVYTHVFEHLWDLDYDIEQVRGCLKDDGFIFIEVPNAMNYSSARVFDYFWFSMPEHINHFNEHYLEMLMVRHKFKKIMSIETIMPYNNPLYGYPSLMMIFRKVESDSEIIIENKCNSKLKNCIDIYISNENEKVSEHQFIIKGLVDSKIKVFVWGIGIEFFSLITFTELLSCNIVALIDKNLDKQNMTVGDRNIFSPERLKQAGADSVVLLTSVFNEEQMRKYLKEISFNGRILVLN